jgi:hypothetical protein
MPEHDANLPRTSRREFLHLSARAALSGLALTACASASEAFPHASSTAEDTAAANAVLQRLLPAHAAQIHLHRTPRTGRENVIITGTPGNIRVGAPTIPALLMGVNWYLNYVAGVSISWTGDSLDHLPARLPAPAQPIRIAANVQHRFALNDTNDGYTGPYWPWPRWERLIDVLALHGYNEVLVYSGAEAVYQQTFRRFHLNDAQMRQWFPTPAHQPWWLLENLSAWVGPSVAQRLIDSRLALAQKITARLRQLEMTPVLPGYFGMVPDGFAAANPGAVLIPQGQWQGMKRPDWLDPTSPLFAPVAAEYYKVQTSLLGPSAMFKMDPMHEGGQTGSVNLSHAATAIEHSLQQANPGAIWAVLGWQKNPRAELLAGIRNKQRMLILDGQSDRFAYQDRTQEWNGTPYAFGTIWNFGGHTTMGANLGVWNRRYFRQRAQPSSPLNGIAVMPEASCNNPAAFAFFSELAWRDRPVDIPRWFTDWAAHRYGGRDANAARAWVTLSATAYNMPAGKWSEAQDSLFSAQPDLHARSACTWSPHHPRYDMATFATALTPLLAIDPSLRNSSAYRYDLVDVARQVVANRSRILLPQLLEAYNARDAARFRALTQEWFAQMDMLEQIVATEPWLLMGRWVAEAQHAAQGPAEEAQLTFDACSLLLEWGPPASRDTGIHDYANREWAGLLGFYRQRWSAYFTMLQQVLDNKAPYREIDWFAMDTAWSKQKKDLPVQPQPEFYATIRQIAARPFPAALPAKQSA